MMLYQWLSEYELTYHVHKCKDSTNTSNQYVFKRIKKYQDDLPLNKFNAFKVQNLLFALYDAKYSWSSIQKVRAFLSGAMSRAELIGLIDKNPVPLTITPSDAPQKKVFAFSREEQALLEEACKNDMYGYTVIFLLYTGLRLSEFFRLRWEDYDPSTNRLVVRKSKSEAGQRVIYLPNRARDIILQQDHINQFIFNSKRRTPFTHTVMNKLCKRLERATGIIDIHCHRFRHTLATRLIEEGADPKAVSTILGHASLKFTFEVYVTVTQNRIASQMSMMNNMSLQASGF